MILMGCVPKFCFLEILVSHLITIKMITNRYNVPTLASIHGPRKVAFFAFGLILLTYGGTIAMGILMPEVISFYVL